MIPDLTGMKLYLAHLVQGIALLYLEQTGHLYTGGPILEVEATRHFKILILMAVGLK